MKKFFAIILISLFGFITLFSQDLIDTNMKNILKGDTYIKSGESTDYIPSVTPSFFVLGTLSDYMGRYKYVDREKQVDRYYSYEKPLLLYLTDYIKTELNLEVETVFEKSKHYEMFSDELSETLNSFYNNSDEIVNSKFEADEQIYSFLTGLYYRYGEKLDSSIYKIQMSNSPKHQNCYDLLKRIGCGKIFYKYLKNIPAQYIIYFEPTEKLKSYLNLIESERILLEDSYYNQIVEMMKGSMKSKEVEKLRSKSKEKEVQKIKNAFGK